MRRKIKKTAVKCPAVKKEFSKSVTSQSKVSQKSQTEDDVLLDFIRQDVQNQSINLDYILTKEISKAPNKTKAYLALKKAYQKAQAGKRIEVIEIKEDKAQQSSDSSTYQNVQSSDNMSSAQKMKGRWPKKVDKAETDSLRILAAGFQQKLDSKDPAQPCKLIQKIQEEVGKFE